MYNVKLKYNDLLFVHLIYFHKILWNSSQNTVGYEQRYFTFFGNPLPFVFVYPSCAIFIPSVISNIRYFEQNLCSFAYSK